MRIKNTPLAYAKHLPLFVLALFLFNNILQAQKNAVSGANTLHAYFRGKTRPLSELEIAPPTARQKQLARKANKPHFTPPNFINWEKPTSKRPGALPINADPVRQDNTSLRGNGYPVQPTLVIEGIDEATSEVGVPDTNGDVSPDHYIQIVNASWFQIFSKDGSPLTPPTSANTIWSQIGEESFSDPVILYDQDAGRWLITDLADIDVVLYGVSETSDPLGAWNLYSFQTPGWADYPKYGIWPNAYILTTNQGNGTYPIYALNRSQMLAGQANIDVQRLEIPGLVGAFPTATPMDWNGNTPPPNNEVYVVRINDDAWNNDNTSDELEVWSILIDWANADNSTATPTTLTPSAYDTDPCTDSIGINGCIPQPNSEIGLDGLETIVMNRVDYRSFPTYEAAVLNYSVNAGDHVAGIRWMELRREPGQPWAIYQEGTFAPNDGEFRFLGSIGMNSRGDIALGYSVTGFEKYPSLRFTGRRFGDPLGEMTVEEFEFASGTGSRESVRYGDYANMSVDPIDDSFWFTSEYVFENGSFGTKIVNFSLGRDTFDIAPISLISPQNASNLGNQEPVTVSIRNIGLSPVSDFFVGYTINNQPAIVEPVAIDTLFPDSIYIHTFGTKADLSVIGQYGFRIFTALTSDQNNRNDTINILRSKLPRYDVAITALIGFENSLCAKEGTFQARLSNYGTETLTTVQVIITINGLPVDTIAWTGNLPGGASTDVFFNLNNLNAGANTIELRTQSPNSFADEIPGNDGFSRGFNIISNPEYITLRLRLDFFPEETSWQIQDTNGQILHSGDGYGGNQFETLNIDLCLEAKQCYKFTIFDSYGDGFFGPNRGYAILDANGEILASTINQDFGFIEENEFCVSKTCSLGFDVSVTNESTVAANDGAILISVTSGAGPFQFSIDGGITFQNSSLFNNLDSGIYQIVVRDTSGCEAKESATINTIIATNEPENQIQVRIFPNPSPNGAFDMEVKGLPGNKRALPLQIVDAAGKIVQHRSIPAINDYYRGVFSLAAYPPGVYYVRIVDQKLNRLIPVIRQ